jgi:hypothetical protein
MHMYRQLSPQVVDDLIGVMSHGAAGIHLIAADFSYPDLRLQTV